MLRPWRSAVSLKLNSLRFLSTLSSKFNSLPNHRQSFLQRGNKAAPGLFEIPELTDYKGFYLLEQNVRLESNALVSETISKTRKRKIIQVFDDLSDALCRVADMADFVRMAHPKAKYREAADHACMQVSSIVQQMNTNLELYNSIKEVSENGDSLCTEEYSSMDNFVTQLFIDDFEKSGIHLDEAKRKRFVELSEGIMLLESHFSQGTHNPATVSQDQMPAHLHYLFSGNKGIAITSMNSDHADEAIREYTYRAYLLPDNRQSRLLEMLLDARDQLAKLTGFSSFAERALHGTMTGSPEVASTFLQSLSSRLLPYTQQDFSRLTDLKGRSTRKSAVLQPWDVTYLSALARRHSMTVEPSEISSYLSLGACMKGLGLLVDRLYGVTLEADNPHPSELWHDTVHKLKVRWSDSGDIMGYIYCDFFERPEKPPQDCHFTIQCGRQTESGDKQIPKVVLMMNFSPPTWTAPTLLNPQQLDNLFHEFGHAMHSMMGRTQYQHVSGTRCSTDFAEVPSILMEYFCSDHRVLREFTSHYQTGEPMPESLIQQMVQSKSLFIAAETQLQVFYSALDLRLHSSRPLESSSQQILAETHNQYYGLPYVENTAWHLRFNHLVGYGAKYFSYLMSRAIAAEIWQKCFKEDPLNRLMGDRYVTEVLAHGGDKPPAHMVESLIGRKPTVDGLVGALVDEAIESGQQEMAESYAKAQRNKRDFDRKMNILHKEVKINMALLKSREIEVSSGLLDVQSKTRNLSETMSFIKQKLQEEKMAAEKRLNDMCVERSNARHGTDAGAGLDEETKLRGKIVHYRNKLDWIDPPKVKVAKAVDVLDIVTRQQGFKGLLTKIRSDKSKLPHIPKKQREKTPEPQVPQSPQDICGLIDHFLKLPKIYPSKPKKVKPEVTTVMMEKYAERAKKKEMSMSYGTRRRLKRVDYLCDSLKDMFLSA